MSTDPKPDILRFFSYAHLPPHLAEASKPFCDLAGRLAELPPSEQRDLALQRLLEAKDAAVRAALP